MRIWAKVGFKKVSRHDMIECIVIKTIWHLAFWQKCRLINSIIRELRFCKDAQLFLSVSLVTGKLGELIRKIRAKVDRYTFS